MQTFPLIPALPLNLTERPKPTPQVPALRNTDSAAMSAGEDSTNDAKPGSHQSDSLQAANLFAARVATAARERAEFPPLDTREVGDRDIIDPMRPTARVPDPLLSLEEAQAGAERPDPSPEPIIGLEEARATPVAPVPDPVELRAQADAEAEAAETAATKIAKADGPLVGAPGPAPAPQPAPAATAAPAAPPAPAPAPTAPATPPPAPPQPSPVQAPPNDSNAPS